MLLVASGFRLFFPQGIFVRHLVDLSVSGFVWIFGVPIPDIESDGKTLTIDMGSVGIFGWRIGHIQSMKIKNRCFVVFCFCVAEKYAETYSSAITIFHNFSKQKSAKMMGITTHSQLQGIQGSLYDTNPNFMHSSFRELPKKHHP